MKSDLNLSIVDLDHSIHSLFSFNQSMAALFTVKGWTNPAQEILVTESIAQEKQQRLTEAFERYVEQPDAYRGHALIALLQEVKVDLTAEYNYAKKQQAYYVEQTEQEVKGGGSFLADWTQWLWRSVQSFFDSSNKALAEKYAQITLYRRSQLEEVSSLLTTLQQERWEERTIKIDDENEAEIIAIDTSKIKASQRRLLQQQQSVSVKNPIPNQIINIDQYYSYSLNDVFSGNYSLLDAVETGQSSLPDWLTLQYELLGSYFLRSGLAYDVAVSGNTAFVAGDNVGLLIVDVSNPSVPRLLSSYSMGKGYAFGVAVSGSTVFVATLFNGLLIVNVSNPSFPHFLGNYSTSLDHTFDVAVSGNIVYVADLIAGLLVVNVSNLSAPRLLSNYSTGNATAVAVFNGTVFIADLYAGLVIVDVSTPSAPRLLGNYPAGSGMIAVDVAVSGSIVYVVEELDGLLILDVSTPSTPRLVSNFSAKSGQAWGLAVSGSTVFIADANSGLLVVDVSNLSAPRLLGSYVTGSSWANAVAVSDSTVFVADRTAGLLIVDVRQGRLIGVPTNDPGQQIDLTVSARNFTTTLVNTTFTLTLDQFPYILQTTVSDQSVFPGQTLSLHLSNSLFVNLDGSFLSLSIQSKNDAMPTGLTLVCSPILIGSYSVGFGWAKSVTVSGNTLYVADSNAGLLIIDVSTPNTPRLLGNYFTDSGSAVEVVVSGNTMFVTDWNAGLMILDVSTPSAPQLLGNYSTPFSLVFGIAVSGSTVFLTDWNAGLLILNVSSPNSPQLLGNYSAVFGLYFGGGVAVSGNKVFLADFNRGLLILNVSTPSAPKLLGNYFCQGIGMTVSGNTVFVADWSAGLLILDVSSPGAPRLLSQYFIDFAYTVNVVISGSTAFVADGNGLLILDVSTPTSPRLFGNYPVVLGAATAVVVSGNTVFLADWNAGLLILDVSQWTLTVTPTMADVGNYPLQLTATDVFGGTASASFTLRVEGPPQFNSKIPPHYAKVGETFSYFAPLGLVTDPNFDLITFDSTLVNGQPLPHWLSFSPISATYAGTPQDGDVGNFTILLTATDNIAGTANTTFNLYVNHVPIVITPLPQSLAGRTGRLFAFQIPATTFSDWSDDPILFYNATRQDSSSLPSWLSFNGSTQNRTFLGTPVIGRDEGTINLIVQATDNWGAYASALMQLSLSSNSPPYVTSQIPDQPARIRDQFVFSLSSSQTPFLDIDGDPLIYTADCPVWLKLEIENQSTIEAPSFWPQWLAYHSTSVNSLTFSGKPSLNDYHDALLVRTSRVVIYAYDDFPNPQSRASLAFDIQVQGINQTGISLAVVSFSMMLGLAIYGAYKKWPALYNCFCKKRYSVNSVTAYIGESFEYKPTAGQPRIQAGEVEEVTVVLPPKTSCCRFFQPYRSLKKGLERPNWMEYDIESDCLRSKSSLFVAKVDNEDQLIVQLRKPNSQIVQQFTLFIEQRPPLENEFKNNEGKQNNDDNDHVELAPLTRFVTSTN